MAVTGRLQVAEGRPRIFIGSSTEGLPIAEKVKKNLSGFADCFIWNEGVFEFNRSYFDTLLNIVNLYDYGILVATGDDFTNSRDKAFDAPRDNVVLEFGLFLGRLGKNRVFLIREDDAKLPSDLMGIALPSFPKSVGPAKTRAIKKICDQIVRELSGRLDTYELGLLPSLPLAYGYFDNFIDHTAMNLFRKIGTHIKVRLREQEREAVEQELLLRDFKLTILIPDELKRDVKLDVVAARFERGWTTVEFDTDQPRAYHLYVNKETVGDGLPLLYDVPTTLNALAKTLTMYTQRAHLGKDLTEQLLESRELLAFRKVLDHEIGQNACFRGRVFTEIVNI